VTGALERGGEGGDCRGEPGAGIPPPAFVPVVAESRPGCAPPAIEIEIGGAILRVGPGVELAFLGEVLRLLKATA
jgi:hypothetical protein